MMRAGSLRHVVTVEQLTEVQDASGDPVEGIPITLGTWRCSIEPIRGREATYAGEHTLGEMDTRIKGRWNALSAQITPHHRLTHQGTIFNVVSVAHVDLGQREVEILARSGINNG